MTDSCAAFPVGSDQEDQDLSLSGHGRLRCAQRGITPRALEWACENGRLIRAAGARFFFVGRRELAAASARAGDRRMLERYNGLVVLVGEDEGVITAYKNVRALTDIRRKQRFDNRHERRGTRGAVE